MSIKQTKEQIAAMPDDLPLNHAVLHVERLTVAELQALADSHTALLEAAKAVIDAQGGVEIAHAIETRLRPVTRLFDECPDREEKRAKEGDLIPPGTNLADVFPDGFTYDPLENALERARNRRQAEGE